MAIYIDYDGTNIKGNCTADGYKDHLVILSLNFGVGRGITMETGNMANREASKPSLSEITVTKLMDNSATELFHESVIGAAGNKGIIKFIQTGSDAMKEYMKYELEDCMVSSYSVSAGSEGDPVESISLSYSKILLTYTDYDVNNKAASPKTVGYNVEKGKKE